MTPDYDNYKEPSQTERSFQVRVPYYFNIAPDRDLVAAISYMSSRGFIYEGKYRQLIKPKITEEDEHSLLEMEARYLHDDKMTNLNRWLLDTSVELDISEKTHLSAQYYRVSDAKYFKEVARTNLNVETLKSQLKLSFDDPDKHLAATILTEDFKVVNDGEPVYTRALEGSIAKTFSFGKKEDVIATVLTEGEEVVNTRKPTTDLAVNFVSTKFDHDDYSKEAGVRTHGNLNISRQLASPHFPIITPNVNFSLTHYNLNNSSDNITRTIAGGGVNIDFTMNNKANLFGREINHRLSPIIQYNYRAKELQGNIPVFDSTDKYDDIITFSDLTSGERYTGLDRITNANDITLSIESSFRAEDALDEDKDLLIFRIAQSFYTDDEVVSDTANTNYETRKTYSDIAASVDVAINNFMLGTVVQFNPDESSIVKRKNSPKLYSEH